MLNKIFKLCLLINEFTKKKASKVNSKHISLFSALFGFKRLNFFIVVGASKGGSDLGLSGPLRGLVQELCLGKQYRF
jgi:hypothetical protein